MQGIKSPHIPLPRAAMNEKNCCKRLFGQTILILISPYGQGVVADEVQAVAGLYRYTVHSRKGPILQASVRAEQVQRTPGVPVVDVVPGGTIITDEYDDPAAIIKSAGGHSHILLGDLAEIIDIRLDRFIQDLPIMAVIVEIHRLDGHLSWVNHNHASVCLRVNS